MKKGNISSSARTKDYSSTNVQDSQVSQPTANEMLGDVSLSEIEKIWLERVKKYISEYKYEYVISWWLRLEYEDERITTTKINYILSKMVKKGILKKETTKSYSKFSFNIA